MPYLTSGGLPVRLPGAAVLSASKPWDSERLLNDRVVSYRRIAVEQPWVSVAVNGMARQIARLPLKVFRRKEDDSRERDRRSPQARAILRPGRRRSQADLKYAIACGLLIDGNHVEEIYGGTDGKLGLRALDWRWLIPYTVDGEVVVWDYQPPDGEHRLLDPSDVVHFRWWGYDGTPFGVSPLAHLGVTIRNEDAAQRWAESNFRNGTRVGLALLMDKERKTTQADREALREEVNSRYVGEQNAGRPMLLGGGIADVKPIGGQNPVEAALIDQRKMNREEILAVYGMPAPLAGDLEHATYSNIESLGQSLFKTVLPPWLEVIQSDFTLQLLMADDPSEWYAEFDLNDAMRGDVTQRVAALKTAIESGQLTINEGRELENRPRYSNPEADEPLVQANNMLPLALAVAKAAADSEPAVSVPEPAV